MVQQAVSIAPMAMRAEGPGLRLLPDMVVLDLDIASRHDAFCAIGRLAELRRTVSAAEVVEQLNRREAMSSTALGGGVALPHAQVSRVRSPLALFLRSRRPVAFDAPDGLPVTDILALIVPRPAMEADFDLLGRLGQWLRRPDRRAALAACERADSICELFSRAARPW